MKKTRLALLLLITILFVSCALPKALTKNYLIMDKYKDIDVKGMSMGVIVNHVSVTIDVRR
ncbi:MAG: hypothetical protein K8S23_16970 [Candidatus Cloacimonetes bacterium]|nr:hypothetical protein [Candidatus Cloacimonadota bacterium]